MSALGISVALFTLSGAFWIVIGALTPPLLNPTGGRFLIISARTDLALFGAAAPELIAADPALGRLRTITLVMLAGMLVASGIFEIAIALFALREGHAWALAALVLAHAAVLPFWWTVFEPYRAAGIALSLADLPPFMWLTTVLAVPAAILGWIGLRT